MATQAAMTVADYLATSWTPDREYVAGEVVERGMPTLFHAWLQIRLGVLLSRLSEHFDVWAGSEGRLRPADDEYRIPDVSLYAGRRPKERVASEPPIVAIEILSPDDKMSDMVAKLRRYREWGVEHVWLADPESQDMWVFGENGLHSVQQFDLPSFSTSYSKKEIFAD